jgi:hypothetical protein
MPKSYGTSGGVEITDAVIEWRTRLSAASIPLSCILVVGHQSALLPLRSPRCGFRPISLTRLPSGPHAIASCRAR